MVVFKKVAHIVTAQTMPNLRYSTDILSYTPSISNLFTRGGLRQNIRTVQMRCKAPPKKVANAECLSFPAISINQKSALHA